ncbi:hypothetical protein [Bradyrhizobium sp. CB3481]|uniref:hypothetical protein n=1 Tax=Bradyrhizobium sp. CB3481 TaxID=3039158 RepID=UPI0024B082BD|nr:hypothetical protein [Bradyrhizobium sp. CB3481]WFU18323.1 hypothetical protein QA643_08250 [Bradyrhizobium sp. CB3481]
MLEQYPDCYEPYLRYAISTDFRNFEAFDEEQFALLLLVELFQAEKVAEFARKMARFDAALGPQFRDHFPHVDATRYVTMRASKRAVLDNDAITIWNDLVSRVELSLPLKTSSLEDFTKLRAITPRFEGAKELLIGVLDDGCPFAAAQFLATGANGSHTTRVRGIWDQNRDKQPVTISANQKFGQEPSDFGFGVEYRRDLPSGSTQIGLNEWIEMHSSPSHVIDEDGCYADAGFTTLARRASHGGHVIDVFAGRIPTSSRVGPARKRRDPPSWKPGVDLAANADVVFVQFSDECIRDATGVWLKDYVVEGIQYILSFAKPNVTKRVIVNLSYGPTTGPHDGTALLEEQLNALIAQFDGTQGKPKLEIVLAAGNAYFSEGHVSFTRRTAADPDSVEWVWRLPPDNSVLCFAEIWMETAAALDAKITLTPPSGLPVYEPTPPPPQPPPILPPAGVDEPVVRGENTMWRLQVEPTIVPPNPTTNIEIAEHGDWKIKITEIGVNAHVHAYVARSDPNMGVRTRAKRSYFVDPNWEQRHSASASCKYSGGEFDKASSLIKRFGTLNGIASAKRARIHVAGGFVIANQRKSAYSSAGPARDAPASPLRVGPDVVLPCDESYALGGIRAGGNRSGAVFRLKGTSAAAPQLARHVADPPIPAAQHPPSTIREKQKRGRGNVDPP